jgi:ABC-type branched-subunit amino acid transport system ATPase component/ABC-type branched-subunit amino acid transport system permease subunit
MFSVDGFQISGAVLMLGAITGMVYGVSAVGLILVYRSSRIINFAHGQIGSFGAAFLALAAINWHFPYWLALLLALAVGGAVAGASEAVIARRLRDAPVVISVVATLGLSTVLFLLASIVNRGFSGAGASFPQPPGLPTFHVGAHGGLLVTRAYSAMLFATPVLVLGLAWFLRKGRLGIAMRAAAANADAAKMAAIVTERMAGWAWIIAGVIATYTAVLVLPTRAYASADFLGLGLLLRALACAVLARMSSLPLALGMGVVLGTFESLLLANYPTGGLVEVCLFGVIVVALMVQRRRTGRAEDKGSWASTIPWEPLPESYMKVWTIRNLGRLIALAGFAVALLLALVVSNATALTLSFMAGVTIVGLSVAVLTGLTGQLSLGQFALAGIGATASTVAMRQGLNFSLAFLIGAIAAAVVSLVLGIPALRIRGLMLAVTSLGFALAAQDWLFTQSWMMGAGLHSRAPDIFGFRFDTGRRLYFVTLAVLAIALLLARNIWVGALGRRLRAVRDNEDAARAFSIAPTAMKLQAFVLAGFLAGLGGAVYASSLSLVTSSAFPLDSSISSAATAVVGGLGVLGGPILGTLYIFGIPKFVPLDTAELAATSIGWLALLLQYPGGLVQAFQAQRDRLVDALARQGGLDPDAERRDDSSPAPLAGQIALGPGGSEQSTSVPAGSVLATTEGLSVSFGGLMAVREVSIEIYAGETVGLIGPNGAGKTTLFEAMSGFVRPRQGAVIFQGQEVTRLSPEQRARRGLIRSFQDAALFPTMTVSDVVALSLERVAPSHVSASLLGRSAPERQKQARARELVGTLGLHDYRNTPIRALSTGTRRIAEIACLVALEPTLLLLDEPTSGIAQRETEALGQVLQRVKAELGLTLFIIEHDIPLVSALSDRLIAMESGSVLATGTPATVLSDPRVIEAYLGGDLQAIERSTHSHSSANAPASSSGIGLVEAPRCRAVTRAGVTCRRPAAENGLCAQHRSQLEVSR